MDSKISAEYSRKMECGEIIQGGFSIPRTLPRFMHAHSARATFKHSFANSNTHKFLSLFLCLSLRSCFSFSSFLVRIFTGWNSIEIENVTASRRMVEK